MKEKGHHTRLKRHEEKGRENVRLGLIYGFLFGISQVFFLGYERVFIVIDDYYSEFSRLE